MTTEHSPLLAKKATPLPVLQIVTLCLVRLNDPISYSQIFPYINEFIFSLHLVNDPSKVGFYSGLVETMFALTQCFTIYPWARLSDSIGRVPVIAAGTLGVGLTTLTFGLSKSLPQLIAVRAMGGIFAGNAATFHSCLAEITDSSNQAYAYPMYGFAWPLGAILGPLLGGYFSNPAKHFPEYFDYPFLRSNPYVLPCVVCGMFSIACAILACTCLEETLPSKRRSNKSLSHEEVILLSGPPMSLRELISLPIIRALTITNCFLSFNTCAFDVSFVLFCYSPIENGGLSFSAAQIGNTLAAGGCFAILLQLFAMPTLLSKFKTHVLYNFFNLFLPLAFLCFPGLNYLARYHAEYVPMGIAVVLMCSRITGLSFSAIMLIIKDAAPNPSSMGATNGLAQTAMSVTRAISPAFVSTCYALSMEHNIMGGYSWAYGMSLLCVVGCIMGKDLGKY